MIRPQYHFRKSGDDTYIWRIEPLLKQRFTPLDLMLGKIGEIFEPYWYDATGGVPSCVSVMEHAALAARSDLSCPILICENHRIIDGMHRVMKAYGTGKPTIRAHQIDLPAPDFINADPRDLPHD